MTERIAPHPYPPDKPGVSVQFRWLQILAAVILIGSSGISVVVAESIATGNDEVESLIDWLLDDSRELSGIPFSHVVEATTGHKVIPVDPRNPIDQELLDKLTTTLDKVLDDLNAPEHPAHQERRINEVSAHFEKALMDELNAVPGFNCAPPKNASGVSQRSGYPDLRLRDETSGRVLYLDPKVFAERNRTGSLRTFYFEPKRQTNKILEDAHHLIIGFEHAGKQKGHWVFTHWNIADLAHFRVKLKAEFQGSNQDLYRQETILKSSRERTGQPN